MQSPIVDVLIPWPGSVPSLSATLASLAAQRYPAFRVSIACPDPAMAGEATIAALTAVLEAGGRAVRLIAVDPSTGERRRREALLDLVTAGYVLLVEDGVYLEPDLVGRLVAAIRSTGCGFVGASVVDLRFRNEHRPGEEAIDFWDGPVRPEEVVVGGRAWDRRQLHRGANLQHLRERLPRTRDRLYRVADIVGCVLYDVEKLRAVGGFSPTSEHGRDPGIPARLESATQLRLLARHGGAGLFPSGAYRLVPAALPAARPAARVPMPALARHPRRRSVRPARPRPPVRASRAAGRHGVASRHRRPLSPR